VLADDNESDDGGYDAAFQAEDDCDDDVREYYDSLTPEVLGSGWFGQRLNTLRHGINISPDRTFYGASRRRDSQPSDLPARHPLRALAWVLAQAPVNSTVRVYCYMLTHPVAIDILIRHEAWEYRQKSISGQPSASKFELRTPAATIIPRCTTKLSSRTPTALLVATPCLVRHDSRAGNQFALQIVRNGKLYDLMESGILSHRSIQTVHPNLAPSRPFKRARTAG